MSSPPPPPLPHQPHAATIAAVTLTSFFIYFITLPPTVVGGDSGDIVVAGVTCDTHVHACDA